MAILRKGFLLTNGSGCYIVKEEEKNEIEERLAEGWRIALIRPICVSMAVKLKYLPPSILKETIFSYSLCILEKNGLDDRAAHEKEPSHPLEQAASLV
jgi:hypothetical protein